jgi:antitoxin (DNA-binding transcriptional repressor) of toxin-antitoxin stability system
VASVSIDEAREKLFELVHDLRPGDEVVITEGEQPVARLLPATVGKVRKKIYRGRLDDFSVERLMRFLTALHRDIRIIVGEKPRRGRGRVIVEAACVKTRRLDRSRRTREFPIPSEFS